MAFPKILEKLFANNGAGPKLRDAVMPDTVLKTTGGTVNGNLTVTGGCNALNLNQASGANYVEQAFSTQNGRRVFTRASESDTSISFASQMYVSEDAAKQYPVNIELVYTKSTGAGQARINGSEILTMANGLPLSGGTMTGTIKTSNVNALQKSNDSSELRITGASDISKGSALKLFGIGHSSYGGQFSLASTDGTTTKYLIGQPNGTLTWNGQSVITSSGSTTFSGTIKSTNNDSITREGTDGYLGLFASGTDWWNNGANLCLYGKDHSSNGGFAIVSCGLINGTLTKVTLSGKANGDLIWGGSKVITSAGGTFSGTIVTSNTTSIRQSSASGGLGLRGGTTTNDGAYLGLYGKDSSEAGMFTIASSNGSKIVRLQGYADGKLTWNGNDLVHVVKTWKSGNNWYRKWSDGWIEQGGIVAYSNVTSGTVTFNTAFTSKPTVSWAASCTNHGEFTLDAINTSNFTWKINANRTGEISWYACGY